MLWLYSPDVTIFLPLNIMEYKPFKEENVMKVVVIKSPKIISGILRAIFHIKKDESEQ